MLDMKKNFNGFIILMLALFIVLLSRHSVMKVMVGNRYHVTEASLVRAMSLALATTARTEVMSILRMVWSLHQASI